MTGVTLTDTASTPSLAACAGQTYRVTLLGASGASLAAVTGVVPGGPPASPATGFASPVDVAAVDRGGRWSSAAEDSPPPAHRCEAGLQRARDDRSDRNHRIQTAGV